MRIDVPVSRTEYEARSELEKIFSQTMLLVAGSASAGTCDAIVAPQDMQDVSRFETSSLVRDAFLIDQERKGDSGFFAKETCIGGIAQAASGQLRSRCFEFFFMLAQLRDVLAAEDSPVVPKEDHHSRALLPKGSEPHLVPVCIGQRDWRKPFGEGGGHADDYERELSA